MTKLENAIEEAARSLTALMKEIVISLTAGGDRGGRNVPEQDKEPIGPTYLDPERITLDDRPGKTTTIKTPPEDDCTVIRKSLLRMLGKRSIPLTIYRMIMARGEAYEMFCPDDVIKGLPEYDIKKIWRIYKAAYEDGDGLACTTSKEMEDH